MPDEGKVPSSIVNILINKISEFAKEIELLRAQLPTKENLDVCKSDTNLKLEAVLGAINNLKGSLDKVILTVKVAFAIAIIAVMIAAFGTYMINRATTPVKYEKMVERLEDVSKTIEKHLAE